MKDYYKDANQIIGSFEEKLFALKTKLATNKKILKQTVQEIERLEKTIKQEKNRVKLYHSLRSQDKEAEKKSKALLKKHPHLYIDFEDESFYVTSSLFENESDADPFFDDHYCHSWVEVLYRLEDILKFINRKECGA